MLISGLPFHGLLFGVHRSPLSRLRLRALESEDARILRRLTDILDFIHPSMDLTD
jgi:hypothetical protein